MHKVAPRQEGRVGSRPSKDPFLAASLQPYHGFITPHVQAIADTDVVNVSFKRDSLSGHSLVQTRTVEVW